MVCLFEGTFIKSKQVYKVKTSVWITNTFPQFGKLFEKL